MIGGPQTAPLLSRHLRTSCTPGLPVSADPSPLLLPPFAPGVGSSLDFLGVLGKREVDCPSLCRKVLWDPGSQPCRALTLCLPLPGLGLCSLWGQWGWEGPQLRGCCAGSVGRRWPLGWACTRMATGACVSRAVCFTQSDLPFNTIRGCGWLLDLNVC